MVLSFKIIKLKAATLVEVIIASVISAISFAIGLMIYMNILHANGSNLKSQLDMYINKDIYNSIEENKYKSETLEFDNIEIQKITSFYKGSDDIILLNYKAINAKGKIILEKNSLNYLEK